VFEARRAVVASRDVVLFAWAIGKALLIVMVPFDTLVYAAWAVTWPRKEVRMVESPRIVSFRSDPGRKNQYSRAGDVE
jgi:hypothetical protein